MAVPKTQEGRHLHAPATAAPTHAALCHLPPSQITTPKDFGDVMPDGYGYNVWYFAAYSVFFSGVSVGLTNIGSG